MTESHSWELLLPPTLPTMKDCTLKLWAKKTPSFLSHFDQVSCHSIKVTDAAYHTHLTSASPLNFRGFIEPSSPSSWSMNCSHLWCFLLCTSCSFCLYTCYVPPCPQMEHWFFFAFDFLSLLFCSCSYVSPIRPPLIEKAPEIPRP